MFDDKRSKKVILVAHCLLNQNARIDRCAYFPGAMGKAAQALIESGVGILQMPCPELLYLGLDRTQHGGLEIGIRETMSDENGQTACRDMADGLICQIKEYQKHGFEIIGVVGNDGSPACGVDLTYIHDRGNEPGTGAFIQALREVFGSHGIDVPFIAVQDHQWSENVAQLKALLTSSSA